MKSHVIKGLVSAAVLFAAADQASALPLTIFADGTFQNDDGNRLISFNLDAEAQVMFRTYSYGGGTTTGGVNVPAGGFDVMLTLFDGAGKLIGQNGQWDFDTTGTVTPDPVTGAAQDAFVTEILPAGDYTLAVTQYDNFSNGLTLGTFANDGKPTFTSVYLCSNGKFCDGNSTPSDNRTGYYALEIAATSVPEPATLALFGLGLAGMGARRRRSA